MLLELRNGSFLAETDGVYRVRLGAGRGFSTLGAK